MDKGGTNEEGRTRRGKKTERRKIGEGTEEKGGGGERGG
jgi:hypothetical protein